jgi:hypothetical protein
MLPRGNNNMATPPSHAGLLPNVFTSGPAGPNLSQLDPTIGQIIQCFQNSLNAILQDREVERAAWRRQLDELERRQHELEARLEQQQQKTSPQGQWHRQGRPTQWHPRLMPTTPAEDTPDIYLERSAALDEAFKEGRSSVAKVGNECV